MKTRRFRTPALSALAVLLISGAGIAFAGTKPAAAGLVAPAAVPAATPVVPPVVEPTPTTPDTGAPLQQGDQTTPDAPGAAPEAAGAPEVAEAAGAPEAPEAAGAPETVEPGDPNLPGGGHADNPNDPNADHQNEGVE